MYQVSGSDWWQQKTVFLLSQAVSLTAVVERAQVVFSHPACLVM